MSADRYEQEYHLTPDGWMAGTYYFYGKAKKRIKAPSNRVLTLIKQVEQSCGFSSEEISWREEWCSNEIDLKHLNRLRKIFGDHPPRECH
jgi:hypothetical protein